MKQREFTTPELPIVSRWKPKLDTRGIEMRIGDIVVWHGQLYMVASFTKERVRLLGVDYTSRSYSNQESRLVQKHYEVTPFVVAIAQKGMTIVPGVVTKE